MSEDYSSLKDTLDHKRLVSHYMNLVIKDLIERAEKHDDTKMESDEVEYFDEYTPKLKGCTYGSPEYLEFLEHLKPALDHHYSRYRHHPEHFPNGIKIVEPNTLNAAGFYAGDLQKLVFALENGYGK